MSQWTHVNGSIRVDGFLQSRELEIRSKLGKVVLWEDLGGSDDTTTLPMGSEGSLRYTVWTNPDNSCLAMHTVNIFGDLRDYDDVDEIKNWFADVIDKLKLIRSAVLDVEVECKRHVVFVYDDDEGIVELDVPRLVEPEV